MGLELNSARSGRRRRVLTEERFAESGREASGEPSSTEDSDSGAHRISPRYGPLTARETTCAITDLIPRRPSVICLLLLIGLSTVAALEALYYYSEPISDWLGVSMPPGLELHTLGAERPHGLAVWFSASMLGVASLLCLLIYTLRRHRVDDYHGRYRIWLWGGLAWLFLSANTNSGLHHPLGRLMKDMTGWSLGEDGAIWWLAPATLLLGFIGVRLLIEVRESRLAAVCLVATLSCWSVSLVTQQPWLSPEMTAHTAAMVSAGTTMGGNVLLLTSLTLYGRYVILDINGQLTRKSGSPALRRPSKPTELGNQASTPGRSSTRKLIRADAAEPACPPSPSKGGEARSKRKNQPDAESPQTIEWVDGRQAQPDSRDDDGIGGGKRKLSKSERKRLRKLKAQHR